MPAIQTKYFGNIEYPQDSRLHFASGLPGFEDQRWFVLLERPDMHPLSFLQSLSMQVTRTWVQSWSVNG